MVVSVAVSSAMAWDYEGKEPTYWADKVRKFEHNESTWKVHLRHILFYFIILFLHFRIFFRIIFGVDFL